MSAIEIYDLRISFIWVRTILDFLKGTAPAAAPMAFLGSDAKYKNTFDALRTGGNRAGDFSLPWFKPKEDYFWFYYLEGTQPGDVNSTLAWKFLVPLRMKVPFKVSAPWFSGRAYLEGFFYPHGVALVFTVESYAQLSLEEARDLAFKARQNEFFDVDLGDGSAARKLHLNTLADEAMTFLSDRALGPNAGAPASPLFSIWTVVRGDGVDPAVPTPEGGDVHRVLEAVTTWHPNFATANLPKLADNSARLRTKRSAGDLLYVNDRGRAIWFPGTFTLPPGAKRSVACYHRNLVYTSMQVESLSRLVRETAQEIQQPGDGLKLPLPQFNCTKRAAGILGRLYLAVEDKTYRSGSPYLHIRQNNFLGDINKVRKEMLSTGDPLP